MPLTPNDIKQFAKSAVESHSDVRNARTTELREKFLRDHRLAARAYWNNAQEDIRGSGYRITSRIKEILWSELERIADQEMASQQQKA